MINLVIGSRDRDVLPGGKRVPNKILEDDRDPLPKQLRPETAYVDAIPPDCAAARFVQTCDHLGQRGLARAVFANQSNDLAAVDLDVGGLQGELATTWVREADGIGPNATNLRRRRDLAGTALGCRGQGKEAIKIIDEQSRLKDRLDASKAILNLTGEQPDRNQRRGCCGDTEAAGGYQPDQQHQGERQQNCRAQTADSAEFRPLQKMLSKITKVLGIQGVEAFAEITREAERPYFLSLIPARLYPR